VYKRQAKDGTPKIVTECTLPLTGLGVVDRIITDRAVLDVTPDGLRLVQLADGEDLEAVQAMTGAPIAH